MERNTKKRNKLGSRLREAFEFILSNYDWKFMHDYCRQIMERNDFYLVCEDFYAYLEAQEKVDRAYADTENMRKRLQNEYEMLKKYRIQDLALDILPVIDNCERALAQETSDEKYRKGVEMIYNQLINALKKEGVEEIDCLNKTFDANFEQAIMMEKVDGVESGIVVQVLQKGYKLKDRILRAAMVKVSE